MVYPSSFFDGATCSNTSGCGGVIFLEQQHFYNLCWRCGSRSNTKVELTTLWGVLTFVKLLGLENMQIYRDSKLVLEWTNGKYNLDITTLRHWKQRVGCLFSFFTDIRIGYIYMELNGQADALPKKRLTTQLGSIYVAKYDVDSQCFLDSFLSTNIFTFYLVLSDHVCEYVYQLQFFSHLDILNNLRHFHILVCYEGYKHFILI